MKTIFTLFTILFCTFGIAQNSIDKELQRLNNKTVPYITVQELVTKSGIVLLDAREQKEYDTSHIKNAIHVGFTKFDKNKIAKKIRDKNTPLVVYCSIGVRSEKIGEQLLKIGYTNVHNLYGGIFEYKNKNGNVVNNQNIVTDSVHTYNKKWGQYLNKGIKIYDN